MVFQKIEEIQPDIFVPNISVAAGFLTPFLNKSGIATVMTHRGDDPLNWGHALYFSSNTDYKCSAIVCVSSFYSKEFSLKMDKIISLKLYHQGFLYLISKQI